MVNCLYCGRTVVDTIDNLDRETTASSDSCRKQYIDNENFIEKQWWLIICDKCYPICNNESYGRVLKWIFGRIEYLEGDGTIDNYIAEPLPPDRWIY